MVRVCGTPYIRKNTCSSSRNSCPPQPTCNSGRVLTAGPSYIRSPWHPPIFHSRISYCAPSTVICPPRTIVVDSRPRTAKEIEAEQRAAAAVAMIFFASLALLGVLAAAVSISRDCRFLGDQCSSPDIFGNQVCTPIYDCKW